MYNEQVVFSFKDWEKIAVGVSLDVWRWRDTYASVEETRSGDGGRGRSAQYMEMRKRIDT